MAFRSNLKFSWLLSVFTLSCSQLIDLTYVLNNKTISWGTSTRFQHNLVHQGKAGDIPYLSTFDFAMSEHVGTHMDAPIHFAEGKWSVDDIPPENLVGPGVVVNISAKSSKDRNAELTIADLQQWEKDNGKISDGSILLVYTGWGKYWPDYKNYMGTDTKNSSLYRFPGIHKDASQWLVNNRKVNGVGIDTASLDYGKSSTFPTHQNLYKNNIFGLENVANLEKVPTTGATIYALPILIGDGSGAPTRIFAMVKSGSGVLPCFVHYLFAILAVIPFM